MRRNPMKCRIFHLVYRGEDEIEVLAESSASYDSEAGIEIEDIQVLQPAGLALTVAEEDECRRLLAEEADSEWEAQYDFFCDYKREAEYADR